MFNVFIRLDPEFQRVVVILDTVKRYHTLSTIEYGMLGMTAKAAVTEAERTAVAAMTAMQAMRAEVVASCDVGYRSTDGLTLMREAAELDAAHVETVS